jgi:hypothetical protein
MKKHVLSLASLFLLTLSSYAQFTAGEIWSLNLRVDPISHDFINLAGIQMGNLTYDSKGVPLTGSSTSTMPGVPTFRITSTVTGKTTVCISSEKEGTDPWEDVERTTFIADATGDTSIIVERSNNGGPFANSSKITIERGSTPNQFTQFSYRWLSNDWQLSGKAIYYLNNSRIDSLVGFKVDGSNFTRNAYTVFYYSNGLDSSLQTVLQASTNLFELTNKVIVTQKENAKTKSFAVYARNGSGMPLQQTGVIVYGNNTPNAINENALDNNFAVYPNPAKEMVNVTPSDNASIFSTKVFDISGSRMNTSNSIVDNKALINTSNLSSGIYFIEVATDKGTATKKIIID